MRNKLLFFLALLLTMMVQVTWAQHVTQEQAKEIASQFLKGQSTKQGGRRNAPAASALKTAVVFNAKDTSGQPYLYAVTDTRQSGFVDEVSGVYRLSTDGIGTTRGTCRLRRNRADDDHHMEPG